MREPTPDEAYKFIEGFLRSRKKRPWKTARYLSWKMRKMSKDADWRMDPRVLETLLHERMAAGKIRYSQFPGRQPLDLLWGHRDKVGDLEELWDTHLNADELRKKVGEFKDFELAKDAEWIFLSHSFVDVDAVRIQRDDLFQRGYGVWIAETGILEGDSIVDRVQAGLIRSDRFAFFATRDSLSSRWVLKEADVARRWTKPPTVIVDREDEPVRKLFRLWVETEWPANIADLINRLIPDQPADPVGATPISTLLVSALQHVEAGKRQVLLYPETEADRRLMPGERWYRTLDEVFPRR